MVSSWGNIYCRLYETSLLFVLPTYVEIILMRSLHDLLAATYFETSLHSFSIEDAAIASWLIKYFAFVFFAHPVLWFIYFIFVKVRNRDMSWPEEMNSLVATKNFRERSNTGKYNVLFSCLHVLKDTEIFHYLEFLLEAFQLN